jgi:hypothetical protein
MIPWTCFISLALPQLLMSSWHSEIVLQNNQISPDRNDTSSYLWGNDCFSTSTCFCQPSVPSCFQLHRIWSSECQSKPKGFAWLLVVNRLNTRYILIRKNFHVSEDHCCILCSSWKPAVISSSHAISVRIAGERSVCPFTLILMPLLQFGWQNLLLSSLCAFYMEFSSLQPGASGSRRMRWFFYNINSSSISWFIAFRRECSLLSPI